MASRPRKSHPPCLHCDISRKIDSRGLCWKCYREPAIRSLYPCRRVTTSGTRDIPAGGYELDAAPTEAKPGSEAKIAALERRAAAGLAIFHPDDFFSADGDD